MSAHQKKLSFSWRLSVALSPHRQLLMGIFSDEFLFRTEEKLWLLGRFRLENEGRHFAYRIDGVAGADFQILARTVSAKEEGNLVQYLEEKTSLRYGPLQTT